MTTTTAINHTAQNHGQPINPTPAVQHPTAARLRANAPPRPLELVFSTAAWLKLQFLCHAGQTEIGAFGITSLDDPLFVVDVRTMRQRTSAVTVEFDDHAVADFFDDLVDAGWPPEHFARVWIHTHPGDSAEPSHVDEATFNRVFGTCTWAVMFILARGGQTFARLRLNTQGNFRFQLDERIPVRVDYRDVGHTVGDLDPSDWAREYAQHVQPIQEHWPGWQAGKHEPPPVNDESDQDALLDWFDGLSPDEQALYLEEAHRREWEEWEEEEQATPHTPQAPSSNATHGSEVPYAH